MSMVPGATAATSAAARAAAEQARKEEEEMTPYGRDDLTEGWEFKILRSMTNAFKDPEKLKTILEQESRAGWLLAEKFDDARIRLKRPTTAKSSDAQLDFDPYRTYVGISQNRYIAVVLLLSVGIPLLIGFFYFFFASR